MSALDSFWLADVWTVLRKEVRELAGTLSAGRAALWVFLLAALAMSAIFITCAVLDWRNNLLILITWLFVPVLPATVAIAESFAGEREHGTFESLLVTPLSPFALLAGKVLSATLFGWAATVVALTLATAVARVISPAAPVVAVAGPSIATMMVLSFLCAAFTALVGAYIVARVATVRQAYVRLSWILAALPIAMGFLFLIGDGLAPDMGYSLLRAAGVNLAPVTLLGVILLGTDAALYAAAAYHFRRKELFAD